MQPVNIGQCNENGKTFFERVRNNEQEFERTIDFGDGKETLETSIRKIRDKEDYEIFEVSVEKPKTLRKARIGNRDVPGVIYTKQFRLYWLEDEKLILTFADKEFTEELYDLLTKRVNGIQIKAGRSNINVKNVIKEGIDTSGGFYIDIDIETNETAALFGDKVNETNDHQKFSDSGDIANQVIEFAYQGGDFSVNVTSSGGLLFYKDLETENILQFVKDIILPHCTPNLPS